MHKRRKIKNKKRKEKGINEGKKSRKHGSVPRSSVPKKSLSPELPKPHEKSLDQITATDDFMHPLKRAQKANA
jgi:hypothetical protein